MVNSKEFKFMVKRIARAAIDDGLRLSAELVDLEKKIDDPDLSSTGKEKARQRADAKRAEVTATFEKMIKDLRKYGDLLLENAEKTYCLQGSQMTDDARLLSGDIPLSADDLRQIIERAGNNYTMRTLAERYRREHFLNDSSILPYVSPKDRVIEGVERFLDDISYLCNFPQKEYTQERFYAIACANVDRNLPDDDGLKSTCTDFN